MATGAQRRRAEWDRQAVLYAEWGEEPVERERPRASGMRLAAIIVLTLMAAVVFLGLGYMWALAEMGML